MRRVFFTSFCLALFVLTLVPMGYAQMIVGHRGASFDAPENTCVAFEEAWRQGADGIEGDFYSTADGQLVCIHDKDTKRTAGRNLMVTSSRLDQLKQLDYGSWKGDKFKGEPIPTFAEVAACIPPEKKFLIELKAGPEIVPLLVEQLKQTQLKHEQLLIIAFDSDAVAKCKELLPDIRAHWLVGYKQDKKSAQWTPTLDTVAQTLADCKADGLGTQGEPAVVTEEFIHELKKRGLREFHVWTIDDPVQARYFQKLGAIGITTNRPALIREAIE
ncbi:MAG: glycerophosphodiester phosphodiesterase [Aureliella sp.]